MSVPLKSDRGRHNFFYEKQLVSAEKSERPHFFYRVIVYINSEVIVNKKRILDLLTNFKKNGEKLDFSKLNFSPPLKTKEATKKAGFRFFLNSPTFGRFFTIFSPFSQFFYGILQIWLLTAGRKRVKITLDKGTLNGHEKT